MKPGGWVHHRLLRDDWRGRRGAGGYIVVLGFQVQQQVADASAYDISLVAGMLEALDDADSVSAEIVAVQRMLPAGQYFGGATRMR